MQTKHENANREKKDLNEMGRKLKLRGSQEKVCVRERERMKQIEGYCVGFVKSGN